MLVLGYHNVLPTAAFGGDDSAVASFRSQLSTVARRCAVVPLVGDEPAGRARRPHVALTFDDGYLDNATVVAELLLDVQLPATFFLVTSFLDGTDYPWWEVVAATCAHPGVTGLEVAGHRLDLTAAGARAHAQRQVETLCRAADLTERDEILSELRDSAGPAGAEAVAEAVARTPMMTWNDARALLDAGFSIGSHTGRHAILAREDASAVAAELGESKQRLETGLGVEVTSFAYPNGAADDFDDTSVRLARQAGYHHAVSTVPGLNTAGTDPLRLRRLVVEPQMSGTTLAISAATQLGGSAARTLVRLARATRRATRTPRPSS
jgi:peptidoglycan/xylan/chitin deacetylase (PgdA/CDA1 family)